MKNEKIGIGIQYDHNIIAHKHFFGGFSTITLLLFFKLLRIDKKKQ